MLSGSQPYVGIVTRYRRRVHYWAITAQFPLRRSWASKANCWGSSRGGDCDRMCHKQRPFHDSDGCQCRRERRHANSATEQQIDVLVEDPIGILGIQVVNPVVPPPPRVAFANFRRHDDADHRVGTPGRDIRGCQILRLACSDYRSGRVLQQIDSSTIRGQSCAVCAQKCRLAWDLGGSRSSDAL